MLTFIELPQRSGRFVEFFGRDFLVKQFLFVDLVESVGLETRIYLTFVCRVRTKRKVRIVGAFARLSMEQL